MKIWGHLVGLGLTRWCRPVSNFTSNWLGRPKRKKAWNTKNMVLNRLLLLRWSISSWAICHNVKYCSQYPVWFSSLILPPGKKNFGTKQMFHQRISATFNRHYLHVCSIFGAQNSDTDNCGILFPGRNPSPLVVDWWAQVGGWRMNLAEPHGLICNIERHEDLLGYVELNIFSPLTQQSHPWQGLWDQCLQTRTWFVGKTLTKIPHCLETQKHLYMFWYLKFN